MKLETSDQQYTFVLYSRYQAIKRALIRGFSINSDIFFRKMIKSFATSVSIDILFCLIIHINILLHYRHIFDRSWALTVTVTNNQ
jgi:hypothetical protein